MLVFMTGRRVMSATVSWIGMASKPRRAGSDLRPTYPWQYEQANQETVERASARQRGPATLDCATNQSHGLALLPAELTLGLAHEHGGIKP